MIAGVVFDKDGTLYDFQKTWGNWALDALSSLSRGDEALRQRLADAVQFDTVLTQFKPGSPAIAGTNAEVALLLASEMPDRSEEEVLLELNLLSRDLSSLAEAVPLAPLLSDLRNAGLRLGVATNDAEDSARAHLCASGVLAHFDQVLGYDSGFGAKPDPGMLLAFCRFENLDPADVVMVGDSPHDLLAGREAGMKTIGVLTGMATPETLAPLADEVLPDIGHLLQARVLRQGTEHQARVVGSESPV